MHAPQKIKCEIRSEDSLILTLVKRQDY